MSTAVILANAIVEHLNACTYSQEFEAKRRMVPFLQREEMADNVYVSVFTGVRSSDLATRGSMLNRYKPVIAVQKKLAASEDAARVEESDALQTLTEEIEQSLQEMDPIDEIELISINEEDDADTYGIDALRNLGIFSVPIVLEYLA